MGYNDQLTHVTEPFGVTLNFAYDADGNRTLVTDSFGGTQASYYDSDNYLTETTYSGQSEQIRIDFTNNGDGMPTTTTSYSDLAGTTLVAAADESYDGDGNVTSIYSTDAGATVLQNYSYSYNSKDQLTAQVENGVTTAFAYDSAGQLTSAGAADYSYDANGNRTEGSDTVTTGNEMGSDGTYNYTYDADGNLTEKAAIGSSASWTYAYNATDELTEVQQYDTSGTLVQTVDYSYDAFGEEIKESVTTAGECRPCPDDAGPGFGCTVITKFAYDGWNPNMAAGTGNADFMQWAVLNGNNSLQSRNINGNTPGQHLARVDQSGASDPSGVYYILSDRLNSVRDVVDAGGTVQDAINYDAYGNIESGETDPSYRGRYAWSGQEFDVQTELQYNNARWYDATTGRWISQDPMGFDAGDSNLYRYVNNAPTNATDPSGFQGVQLLPPVPDVKIPKIPPILEIEKSETQGPSAKAPITGDVQSPVQAGKDTKFECTVTAAVNRKRLGGTFYLIATIDLSGDLKVQPGKFSLDATWKAAQVWLVNEKKFSIGKFFVSAGFYVYGKSDAGKLQASGGVNPGNGFEFSIHDLSVKTFDAVACAAAKVGYGDAEGGVKATAKLAINGLRLQNLKLKYTPGAVSPITLVQSPAFSLASVTGGVNVEFEKHTSKFLPVPE